MDAVNIKSRLYCLRDEKYADFSAKLIPGFENGYFVGVRTPLLRAFAREIVRAGDYENFLTSLPHEYFEENLLHAFILANEKLSVEETIKRVELFLPYIDNWAVCDQFSVKLFGKYPSVIYPYLKKWMTSDHLYTCRFGVVNSMRFFLDEKFEPYMLDDVAAVTTGDYYMQMAVAWYFATALAKQWNTAISFVERRRLPAVVHRMTIRKALESFRVGEEQKGYLRKFL
ncbi:MAG: DNA alkylation repair protein [Bacteroidales bacterium]|nr:DNA alkylation repair protein [Bacteroidales bacterium]